MTLCKHRVGAGASENVFRGRYRNYLDVDDVGACENGFGGDGGIAGEGDQ